MLCIMYDDFFFFNDTATTEIYTLSLHDALPIYPTYFGTIHAPRRIAKKVASAFRDASTARSVAELPMPRRSEEHTSELQSRQYLVCRLLLEKKKNINAE